MKAFWLWVLEVGLAVLPIAIQVSHQAGYDWRHLGSAWEQVWGGLEGVLFSYILLITSCIAILKAINPKRHPGCFYFVLVTALLTGVFGAVVAAFAANLSETDELVWYPYTSGVAAIMIVTGTAMRLPEFFGMEELPHGSS